MFTILTTPDHSPAPGPEKFEDICITPYELYKKGICYCGYCGKLQEVHYGRCRNSVCPSDRVFILTHVHLPEIQLQRQRVSEHYKEAASLPATYHITKAGSKVYSSDHIIRIWEHARHIGYDYCYTTLVNHLNRYNKVAFARIFTIIKNPAA